METLKKLLKCEAKLLTEADKYAEKYKHAKEDDDMLMADYYYTLADMHLQGFMKTKTTIAAYLNKHTDKKDIADIYTMVRDLMDDFHMEIKEKM